MKYENRGPWDNEPDTDEFEAHGLECHMMRNLNGVWCGYVISPNFISARLIDEFNPYVHWGVTWNNDRLPGDDTTRDTSVIGFDCGHLKDASHEYPDRGIYRTHEYAKAKTIKLAEQVAKAARYAEDLKECRDWLTVTSKQKSKVVISSYDAELLIDVIAKSGILCGMPTQTEGQE